MELKNANVIVRINAAKKEIFAQDLTDTQNETSLYTTTKRGFNRACLLLAEAFKHDEALRFSKVRDIIRDAGLRTHTYCAID